MRVAQRKREVPDPFALPDLGGRVVNLEHPQTAEQVRAPPGERVKPGAEDHVLREGARLQPVLGQPTANADRRVRLAADLAGDWGPPRG